MSIPVWQFGPQTVTPAELQLLMDAATDPALSVSDDDHPRSRRTAGQLARKGLVTLSAGASAGWGPGMWMATLTVNGWNAMWRKNGNRHEPGCGGSWQKDGTCVGCGERRRLDENAFEDYIEATTDEERAYLTGHSRLFCDEHGYARQRDWTTDKICRGANPSPTHSPIFIRL